uniref:Cysteine-rich DPF motif domain-containing protein 1 n=1 Tax=Sinocyclocheilus grahami TaxID=75366 RepID=A0A672QJ91_SINGR
SCYGLLCCRLSCRLLEECYGTKDPFSPEREKFLVLGSKCCLRNKKHDSPIGCYLFYTERFCLPCVRDHLWQFPERGQNEVLRKKSVQKTSSS